MSSRPVTRESVPAVVLAGAPARRLRVRARRLGGLALATLAVSPTGCGGSPAGLSFADRARLMSRVTAARAAISAHDPAGVRAALAGLDRDLAELGSRHRLGARDRRVMSLEAARARSRVDLDVAPVDASGLPSASGARTPGGGSAPSGGDQGLGSGSGGGGAGGGGQSGDGGD